MSKSLRETKYPLPKGMQRTHANMEGYYGVCRPGKTEQDRLKGGKR